MTSAGRRLGASTELRQFLRFGLVGAIGFAVDASILTALTRLAAIDPISARFVSFPTALALTWYLNRSWSFTGRRSTIGREFLNYLGVQSLGFICNFVVYTLLVLWAPWPFAMPLPALIAGAIVGLIANFSGMRLWVFGRDKDEMP